MAAERLKFRCYRCSQLLSVSPNRAGTVVSCPKCKADLLIPAGESQPEADALGCARNLVETRSKTEVDLRRRPDAEARAGAEVESGTGETAEPARPEDSPWAAISAQSPPSPGSVVGLPDELAAMIPPDLVDLRPEDLRVEAEFFESLTRRPPRMTAAEPPPWSPPEAPTPDFSHEVLVSPAPPPASFETAGTADHGRFARGARRAKSRAATAGRSVRAPDPDRCRHAAHRDRAAEYPSPGHHDAPRLRSDPPRPRCTRLVAVRLGRHRHVIHRRPHDRALPLENALRLGRHAPEDQASACTALIGAATPTTRSFPIRFAIHPHSREQLSESLARATDRNRCRISRISPRWES